MSSINVLFASPQLFIILEIIGAILTEGHGAGIIP